ncbi:hypothetical protein CHGG_09313 [Chaetomium globosum CBS 148.51]|uniref:MACPF-like domain-containing protein n=1 Tax=Chaetomium globosum (strain ATCC 6205 / CBS 148.51 / DSM 1962 / NBRC 6347 / NRRL 1970) TaxID=306901 RepID=Q2GRU1_CHAGB|nr:uncharacterized protein CHGG_09313 [Chaetomium globosum CBS 148.51]EAQ85299.1 hypothetical protein CHGG_09313 [Chaetomium globosum CBS 148.51]
MPALRRVEAQTPPAQKPVAKQSDRESVKPATNMATEQRSGQGGTAGGSVFVKVLSLVAGPGGTDEDDVQISEMPISTLQFASTQTFKFCSDDCAAVPENISLDAYSKLLHTSGSQEAAASQLSVLLKPPFQLKFIQMGDTPSNALNMGALHSSAFKGQDPSHMPMGQLRRLIGKMYGSSAIPAAISGFSFCQMDEADWDAVLRNCALLYGWRIDKKTNRMVRASTPAFRLRNKAPIQPPVAPRIEETPEPTSPPKAAIEVDDASEGSASGDTYADTEASDEFEEAVHDKTLEAQPKIAKPLTAEDVNAPIPAKLGAVPSYVVNDRSRIEVTTVMSEFQESMAKNHFSSTSVEASVSGGYAGFSVGVTGGVASESSSGQSSSNKTYSKRMIASYMFPRVSVFLRPEDLEPTQELRDALEAVRKTKNINMLRNLYQTFGHLFCYTATLGGCLQTTKIVTGNEQTQQSKEKESFKASVGVAVSTPFGVGGSVKASHETQDSSDSFQRTSNTSEAMTFEATGGNSILAANPPAWSSSVADFNNWRVIEQSDLHPISETISQIPGYGQVQAWFFSAVPKLSQYVVIPESRVIHIRFKAISHSESPALERITGVKNQTQGYLGHIPDKPPKPIRTSLERTSAPHEIGRNVNFGGPWGVTGDITVTTRQVKTIENEALFFPHWNFARPKAAADRLEAGGSPRLRCTPLTLSQAAKREGKRKEKERLIRPPSQLGPDCLVSIKSCAPVSSSPPSTSPPELGLTVYRNAQGVFQPAITSTDEPSYWRIQAVDTTTTPTSSPSSKRDPHRHGDLVRLTWSFADQASGFRDFFGDVYGRRSYRRPAELGRPRHPLPQGNGGVGDASDFMNVVTDAHGAVESNIDREHKLALAPPPPPPPFSQGSPESVVAGILLGPFASPVLGVVSSAIGSIFGF